MNLEDKAREFSKDVPCTDGDLYTYNSLKKAFIAGHQSRDEEVKRLEQVVLEMSEELKHSHYADAYWLLDKHSSLIKELKERG